MRYTLMIWQLEAAVKDNSLKYFDWLIKRGDYLLASYFSANQEYKGAKKVVLEELGTDNKG